MELRERSDKHLRGIGMSCDFLALRNIIVGRVKSFGR